MKNQTISILGCGWLGLPLAKQLITKGYTVNGSTTSPDKRQLLDAAGITSCHIDATPTASLPETFFDCDTLIITLPFRRRLSDPFWYPQTIKHIMSQCKPTRLKKLLFTSSTSIYSNNYNRAKETDTIIPESDRQAALLEAENLISNTPFTSTVIRLGGLYGPDRPAGRFFANKTNCPGGLNAVNMIEQADAVAILTRLIEMKSPPPILNAVHPEHPTKIEFYNNTSAFMANTTPHKIVDTTLLESLITLD